MQLPESSPHVLQLTRELRRLCGASEHLSHAYAEERGIYLTDFRALLLIRVAEFEKRSLTAGELASCLNLSSGAVTYLVERLFQSGHVTRETDPQDRRKVLLSTSKKGVNAVDAFFDPLYTVLREATKDVIPEEAERTIALLSGISTAIHAHTDEVRKAQKR